MKNLVRKQHTTSAASIWLVGVFAVSSVFLTVPASGATAKPAKPAPATPVPTNAPAVFVVPRSEFLDDYKVGRDPFFPNSTRRFPKGTAPVPTPDKGTIPSPNLVAMNPKAFLSMLTLKGISKGARGRKFAVISDYTFAPGESFFVRMGGATNRVKCEEIRDQFVVVSVEGVDEKRKLYIKQAEVVEQKKTPDPKPR